MYGPKLTAAFDRGKGDGPIDLELCMFKDQTEAAKLFVGWLNDNQVRQFMLMLYPYSLSKEEEWMSNMGSASDEIVWGIYANGGLVGSIGLVSIDRVQRRAEIGILIGDKSWWGKGIATAAEALVAEFAFSNIVAGGLNKLFARVFVGNEASKKALQRVGFREIGIFRREHWNHGRWFDMWTSDLLQDEWFAARKVTFNAAGITKYDVCPGCEWLT